MLKSGKVDQDAGTIELPLYKGRLKSDELVWYVVTATTDKHNADALGLNHSPKLVYTEVGKAARQATLQKGDGQLMLVFDAGKVDFKPKHSVTPGKAPNFFPPTAVQPGAVGDANYSPLVKIVNAGGHIYNAPMVAFNTDADTLNKFCNGGDDSLFSAVERIFLAVNGPTGKGNPQRQGLNSALSDGGPPLKHARRHPDHRH